MASTDEELVARSMGGDLESFNQLVLRWERPIYALAYRVIGREDDARDVCQETFLRAFRALGGFKGQAKFSSWLYRITLNLCRDWIRRQRRQPIAQAPEGVDLLDLATETTPVESVEDLVARREISMAVQRAMARTARRAAHGHHSEGISRAHVPGNRGPARLSAQHGQDTAVSGAHRAAAPAGRGGDGAGHVEPGGLSGVIADCRLPTAD